jgi:hypothetical protein
MMRPAPPKSPRHQETQIRVVARPRRHRPAKLATGIGFFDHMLDQIARHGLIDLEVEAQGDLHIDGHHTVEDVGITLGQAVAQAVGDKKGIRRYGHAYVPLDEALSRVVIDFSGRPGLHMDVPFTRGADRRVRRRPRARVLPGLRQPRARHAARRQPARRQRAPPVRDGVQGLRARAAHGGRARSARRRRGAVDQGQRCSPTAHGRRSVVVDYGMGNLRSVSQAVGARRAAGGEVRRDGRHADPTR